MELIFNFVALAVVGLQLLFIGYIIWRSSSKETKELIRELFFNKAAKKVTK